MVSQRERLKDIMVDMARGRDIGNKLEFDPRDKRVKPVSDGSYSSSYSHPDPDGAMNISKTDADLFGGIPHSKKPIIKAETEKTENDPARNRLISDVLQTKDGGELCDNNPPNEKQEQDDLIRLTKEDANLFGADKPMEVASEESRTDQRKKLREILIDIAANKMKYRLIFTDNIPKETKKVFQDEAEPELVMTKDDAELYCELPVVDGRIVVSSNTMEHLEKGLPKKAYFSSPNDEQVFQLLGNDGVESRFPGIVIAVDDPHPTLGDSLGFEDDKVRLLIRWSDLEGVNTSPKTMAAHAVGLVRQTGEWVQVSVDIVPVKEELFSRFGGLLETNALADAKVAIFGQGSGGSHIAIELVKSGVGRFHLIDHDRLEVCNVARHQCDLADIGRLKVRAMADAIKRKNPYADVTTWPLKAEWEQFETVLEIVREVDLVFAATDSHASKLLINQASVQEGKTCIFAGAHRRAHGGQVIRVRPGKSICFQCFSMLLPDQAQDQEISSEEYAEGLAYTDRPVAIEPGLSTDIAPISLMATKIGIQELLRDKPTTFRSLDQDLVADWFLWLNRREAGTQFENLKPLAYDVDGMHILRWYGIKIDRHEGCPICGDFEANYSDENLNAVLQSLKVAEGVTN